MSGIEQGDVAMLSREISSVKCSEIYEHTLLMDTPFLKEAFSGMESVPCRRLMFFAHEATNCIRMEYISSSP